MCQRIVVCDDEAHVTRSVAMKLNRAGFEVESAPNGSAALDSIRREIPALLITDCQMPLMDGVELCRQLRADPATSGLPVILLTAKAFEMDSGSLQQELRISHIVSKPFSPRELLRLVNETLGTKRDVVA